MSLNSPDHMLYSPKWYVVLALSLWMAFGYGCGDDTGSIDPNGPPASAEAALNVIINEVFPETSQIELHNPSSIPADMSGFWLCHTTPALVYDLMPDDTIIDAGGFLIVHWGTIGTNTEKELFTTPAVPIPLNKPHGEFGLYTDFGFDEARFAISEFIQDYVQWGEDDHFRERVAVGADIWPEGAFVPAPSPEQSLSFDGNGNAPEDWVVTAPTIGSANILP